jgi:hypothetical protein
MKKFLHEIQLQQLAEQIEGAICKNNFGLLVDQIEVTELVVIAEAVEEDEVDL